MDPRYEDNAVTIYCGDCLEVMASMEPSSIDAIVSDPPYGLSFMGREWDHGVPGEHFWREALRVAKPGAHLVAFGGTRTHHRLMVAIEDAGWEIRDCLGWLYGSGFPKSLDVSKAIDKEAGIWRGRAGCVVSDNGAMSAPNYERTDKGDPVTEAAQRWQGWGTALKPAWEPIILARKPLGGTVAANVQQHGTGALNIDGCRVHIAEGDLAEMSGRSGGHRTYGPSDTNTALGKGLGLPVGEVWQPTDRGRWPANIVHDGSDDALSVFPGDNARFFYCAKPTKAERDAGMFDFEERESGVKNGSGRGYSETDPYRKVLRRNTHPTVKPIALMRWLVRLVTPPDGVVLDPFMGSGTTLLAARAEGFRSIGADLEADHCDIAWGRMSQGVML